MGFFNMDGPIYKIGNIIADILILGVLWILLAIPVVTIGASTSAVYYVCTKRVNGREGYLWQDFWKSFRQNFLTATAVWLTLLVAYGVLSFNIINAGILEGMANIVLVVSFIIFVQMVFIHTYVFALISRFEMGYREVFKTAFFLANRHILLTVANAILLAGLVLISLLQPIFVIPAAGAYFYFSSFLVVKAFKKYRPDLDVEANLGELGPLQFDDDDKGDDTVLNLDKLKEMQDDKEE